MIAIRTNCNGTLGHLARTRHLARELGARGHEIVFLLDHPAPRVPDGWLDGFRVVALYADDAEAGCRDELDDAGRTLARLDDESLELLVVDDYRLGIAWERAVSRANVPLVALDDLGREHVADLLVEPGLAREGTTCADGAGEILRGAEFVMLDTEAFDAEAFDAEAFDTEVPGPATLEAAAPETAPSGSMTSDTPALETGKGHDGPGGDARSDDREVLLSLGGGGDLAVLAELLEHVTTVLTERQNAPRVTLRPVIGPQANGGARIEALAALHPDVIRPVRGARSLLPWLRRASLFVGAAGTAVYESAACGVPAITFPIADNQENVHDSLERLGHYLHVDAPRAADRPALARLIVTALDRLPRLRALREDAARQVDGRGAERVAGAIGRLLDARGGSESRSPDRERGTTTPVPVPVPARGGTSTTDRTTPPRDDGFRVVACDDRDVNRYLDARNLPANRGNMTSAEPIARVAHYHWWLTTRRRSWRAERRGVPELYIWHQTVVAGGVEALIGGWFVCRESVDVASVMAALQWQLETTDRETPHLPWVAVIRRGNAFTRQMNRRSGFVDVSPGAPEERAIGELFPDATREAFHFVHRRPIGSPSSDAA